MRAAKVIALAAVLCAFCGHADMVYNPPDSVLRTGDTMTGDLILTNAGLRIDSFSIQQDTTADRILIQEEDPARGIKILSPAAMDLESADEVRLQAVNVAVLSPMEVLGNVRIRDGELRVIDPATNTYFLATATNFQIGAASFRLDQSGALADNWNLGGYTISNGVFIGDGAGLTNVAAGGVSAFPLNGSSALDWGVVNGTMSRAIAGGYSTIYADNDVFAYTDRLPLYSAEGGSVTTNYFGAWRDADATVNILQQVSSDNGSTWTAVTNSIAATTNATVFGLSSIALHAGRSLYRVAVATNETAGTLYIYQIDARGTL